MKTLSAIFTIFFCSYFNLSISQSFRTLTEGNLNYHCLVEDNDGSFYLAAGWFMKFDNTGSFQFNKSYFEPKINQSCHFETWLNKTVAGDKIYMAIYYDSCFNAIWGTPLLCKLANDGNVLKSKSFLLNGTCAALGNKFNILSSSNYLVHGYGGKPYNNLPNASVVRDAPFALCVDSTLENVVYAKYFNRMGNSAFACEVENGSVVLGLNLDTIGPCLAKLDSAGNILWCRSYMQGHGLFMDAVSNADGSIMVTGYTDTIAWGLGPFPSWFYTKLLLMKIDSGGAVLWSKGYDDTHPYHFVIKRPAIIQKTYDGNYMLGATKITSNTMVSETAYLLKVNTNGDLLWHNGFGLPSVAGPRTTELYNFIPTHDSCYLITGNFLGGNSWTWGGSFLYKTDTSGTTPCGGNFVEPITTTPLFYSDSLITLGSIDGATVQDAYVIDTVGGPLNTMDDCILLSTNNETTNTYHAPAFPNPTNGEVTVPSSKIFERDSYVTVYDSTGRIIIQYGIAGKQTLKFNLSKFGSGLYLIKINEQGKIRTEQVVVE
ncbi:MAG TPA: T9SS type A sorting domain-containing protein [Bacteroidia bacterium]|nr:T9SS type A sorting domain-containing protein [Bacteroidia bacterium]